MNMVTGDDFGISHEVNEAVEAHYQAGWLSQASLMIHGNEVDEALRIARRNSGLCIGLHLTLCAGSRPGRTLLTDAAGRFEPSPARAGWNYFWRRNLRDAIRDEIEEQFSRFLEAGLPPIHWDGHTHLHLHPVIMREALTVAVRNKFRAVRLLQMQGTGATGRVLNWLSAAAKSSLDKNGIRYPERTWGFEETGKMDEASYRKALLAAEDFALSEIYYHPGVDGPPIPETGNWKPETAEMNEARRMRMVNWAMVLAEDEKSLPQLS